MMKWLWALIALGAYYGAAQAATPGALALMLLIGMVATVASFFGFLAARVASVAQSQPNRETALLVTARGRAAAARRGSGSAGTVGASVGTASVLHGDTSARLDPDRGHHDATRPGELLEPAPAEGVEGEAPLDEGGDGADGWDSGGDGGDGGGGDGGGGGGD